MVQKVKSTNSINILFSSLFLLPGFSNIVNFKTHRSNCLTCINNKDAKLKQVLESNKVNGLILVSKNNDTSQPEVISNKLNNINYQKQLSYNRYFPIASLQKGITGVAVYHLINSGEITLNTHLNKFFPKMKNSNNITIEQLMTHQSGICDKYKKANHVITEEKERQKFLFNDFSVKKKHSWKYSSSNFGILAAIIRLKIGETYFDYVKRNILYPSHLYKIRPFEKVNNVNEVSLPVKNDRKKFKILISVLRLGMLVPKLSFINIPRLISFISCYHLYEGLSENLGAGDFLATPKDYWKFLYRKIINNRKVSSYFYKKAQKNKIHYFGGYYFKDDYILADGALNKFNCCSTATNYKNKRTIMKFTNNISFKEFKKIQREIYQIYFKDK